MRFVDLFGWALLGSGALGVANLTGSKTDTRSAESTSRDEDLATLLHQTLIRNIERAQVGEERARANAVRLLAWDIKDRSIELDAKLVAVTDELGLEIDEPIAEERPG